MVILKPLLRSKLAPVTAAVAMAACLAVASASASAATWTLQTTPNAAGAEHSALYDISCDPETINNCIAVGKQTASGGNSGPYAQKWNGTSWTNDTLAAPEGATAGELQSVHCIEKGFCFAAGSYTAGGVTRSLIERLFLVWTIGETPNPAGASETALKGISCLQGGTCAAVGYSVDSKTGKKTAFVLGWSAEGKWEIQKMPEPEGAVSSELHGVDCPVPGFCMAVGSYTTSGGSVWTMTATWNGTFWTPRTVLKPTGSLRTILLDVSCSSSLECTGVGGYRNSSNVQLSFVQRWNGASWSHQSSPNPIGSTNTVFQNVSCIASTPCVAVGDWHNGKGWQPMAQAWNGSTWALDTTPNPTGATETILEGVACRTGCLSVGWYADSLGKTKTLAEKR